MSTVCLLYLYHVYVYAPRDSSQRQAQVPASERLIPLAIDSLISLCEGYGLSKERTHR